MMALARPSSRVPLVVARFSSARRRRSPSRAGEVNRKWEEGCEQLSLLKPPPAGPLRGDPWQSDVESDHFKRSLAAGMSPANLYGALLLMDCEDELEENHLSGLSLRDYRIARTIMGHRIHGLHYTSGFDTRTPTDLNQYRPTSRNFLVEAKISKWKRKSFDGAVIFNNALPWMLEHLHEIYSRDVAAAIRPQLEEASCPHAPQTRWIYGRSSTSST